MSKDDQQELLWLILQFKSGETYWHQLAPSTEKTVAEYRAIMLDYLRGKPEPVIELSYVNTDGTFDVMKSIFLRSEQLEAFWFRRAPLVSASAIAEKQAAIEWRDENRRFQREMIALMKKQADGDDDWRGDYD